MRNENYHSCLWCKFYEKGRCCNGALAAAADDIHPFFEEGTLAEAIREGMREASLPKFEMALSQTRLSVKAQKALLHTLYEELETRKVNWVEGIDASVSTALLNRECVCAVDIVEPHNFYCKEFE